MAGRRRTRQEPIAGRQRVSNLLTQSSFSMTAKYFGAVVDAGTQHAPLADESHRPRRLVVLLMHACVHQPLMRSVRAIWTRWNRCRILAAELCLISTCVLRDRHRALSLNRFDSRQRLKNTCARFAEVYRPQEKQVRPRKSPLSVVIGTDRTHRFATGATPSPTATPPPIFPAPISFRCFLFPLF